MSEVRFENGYKRDGASEIPVAFRKFWTVGLDWLFVISSLLLVLVFQEALEIVTSLELA